MHGPRRIGLGQTQADGDTDVRFERPCHLAQRARTAGSTCIHPTDSRMKSVVRPRRPAWPAPVGYLTTSGCGERMQHKRLHAHGTRGFRGDDIIAKGCEPRRIGASAADSARGRAVWPSVCPFPSSVTRLNTVPACLCWLS